MGIRDWLYMNFGGETYHELYNPHTGITLTVCTGRYTTEAWRKYPYAHGKSITRQEYESKKHMYEEWGNG